MTADERRGVILDIICARRYETIDNLAFELDAGRRTIERDVLHLSLRFSIYTTKGHGGGVWVVDDYKRDTKYLSPEQLTLLNKLSRKLKGKDADVMASMPFWISCSGTQIRLNLCWFRMRSGMRRRRRSSRAILTSSALSMRTEKSTNVR